MIGPDPSERAIFLVRFVEVEMVPDTCETTQEPKTGVCRERWSWNMGQAVVGSDSVYHQKGQCEASSNEKILYRHGHGRGRA